MQASLGIGSNHGHSRDDEAVLQGICKGKLSTKRPMSGGDGGGEAY